jgi:hypothetical protein
MSLCGRTLIGTAHGNGRFETITVADTLTGDARHGFGKRIAAAVGEGSATVNIIHEVLRTV